MGLSFADSSTNVLIAQVTNSVGELDGTNSVVYPNAFDSLRAAIRLTYTRSGIEQDVILYQQLPAPENLGLDPASTKLQMWTEVLTEVAPQISPASGGDRTLDFGQTRIGHGVIYLLNSDSMDKVGLQKDWVEIDGRRFIVESVLYATIKPLLAKLQASTSNSKTAETANHKAYTSSKDLATAFPRRSRLKEMAAIQPGRMSGEPGLLLDYLTLNTSLTNYVFHGDTTYWLSGNVSLFGTNTTFEAGSILKSTNGVSLTVYTPVSWLGTMWRPVILTSKDDTSCGNPISGATGNPGTNIYAATALAMGIRTSITIQHVRIANAQTAINFVDGGGGNLIKHAQIVACQCGIAGSEADFTLRNALFWNVQTNFTGYASSAHVEHLTSDTAICLNNNIGPNLFLTNCLLVNVQFPTNFTGVNTVITNSSTVFTNSGEGFHYLADNTYRALGTTNVSILSELRKMTTYPPALVSNTVISSPTTWSPSAPRDTNTTTVDLGYHYCPLDYLINNVSNSSTLTLTNGVAVGVYGNYGINLQGGSLYSQGTPVYLNVLTRYQAVQEQPATLGGSPTAILYVGTSVNTIKLRFTDCPALAYNVLSRDLLDYSGPQAGTFILSDCQFRGSEINISAGSFFSVTNNLMERGYFSASRSGGGTLTLNLRNNLFWFSALNLHYDQNSYLQNPTWGIMDNVFDNCSIFESGTTYWAYITSSYNGYVATSLLSYSGGHDVSVSTFNYATGALGPWYQSSTNMIDAGSRTADLAGLYHYTTTTNQVPETNSVVDIGFHYVALDTSGNPADTDLDGIPDYIEDANGDGIYDSGDPANWQVADTDGDGILDGWAYYHGLNPQVSNKGGVLWWNSATGAVSRVGSITNAIAIAGGGAHALLIQEGGAVVAWGSNTYGQTNVPANTTNAIAIAAGDNHSLALKADGTVVAWGRNTSNQTNVPGGLTNVVAVAAGGDQSLALLSSGAVTNWGTNFSSMPGDLTNIMAVAAGTNFCLALRSNGTVVAWGNNSNLQTSVPASATNVVAIAAGGDHALALCSNGTVVAWGNNSSGQTNVPSSLTNAMGIAAGYTFSVAFRNDGTLIEWGDSAYAMTSLSGLGQVKLIAAGGNQSIIGIFSSFTQYQIDVTKDLLLIWNTNSPSSLTVKDYYLAHRPLVSNANVLGFGCPTDEQVDLATFTNQIVPPVLQWFTNNPTKHPQYLVLFPDFPTGVHYSLTANSNNCRSGYCPVESVAYGLSTSIPGIQPFVTSINMGLDRTPTPPDPYRTNDCIGYINKLAAFGTNGQLIISASAGGYGNTNYVLDDVRHGTGYGLPYNQTDSDFSNNGDKVWSVTNALAAAGVAQSAIRFYDGLETCLQSSNNACISMSNITHVATETNLAGYICWGAHSSLQNEYPRSGSVVWGSHSSWWIISTLESYNGWRDTGQGNFTQWFSYNGFGYATFINYENTPVGAVTHTDEPGLPNVEDASVYFGLWALGKNLAICGWNSRINKTPPFSKL
jgi:hypothetical protein